MHKQHETTDMTVSSWFGKWCGMFDSQRPVGSVKNGPFCCKKCDKILVVMAVF